jgi:hypothetical protein
MDESYNTHNSERGREGERKRMMCRVRTFDSGQGRVSGDSVVLRELERARSGDGKNSALVRHHLCNEK